MTDLTITLTGEVRESNFEEWKDALVGRIRAVDVDLVADDDFATANDSIRQFRDAEQTLKAAKQAALEQAADINRLFDAVDAVAEETRQARLGLERKIRARREEAKRQTLQAHVDANAGTLDALPAAHRALFQDRAALLHLSTDELAATIEERVAVWEALDERAVDDARTANGGGDERAPGVETRPDADVEGRAEGATDDAVDAEGDAIVPGPDDGVERAWRVTIELSAHRSKAEQLFTRVRDRWKADRAVKGIDLSAED